MTALQARRFHNACVNAQALSLLGAPTDVGAGERGTGMGPDALRVAGITAALQAAHWQVTDLGNLSGPLRPEPFEGPGLKNLSQVVAWNRLVFDAVDAALGRGHFPLLLGGDHSLAIGSISAIAWHCRRRGKPLRVLWLDAHADVNDESTSPTGHLHGMPVACLLGHGPAALVGWSGQPAALAARDLALIGVRSVDSLEKQAIARLNLRVMDMRHIDEVGMRHSLTEALQGVDGNTHLHVSLDLDCLDPLDAPGVSCAVRGGPSYREMQLCMEMIADARCLSSLDLMELNPARDLRNQTAELAVDLVRSLMGASTLAR